MSRCLVQGSGEPSGSGDGARCLGGELGLAEFGRCGRGRYAFGFLQGLQDGGLADPGEVVFSCGRELLRHIKLQGFRKGIGVSNPLAVRAVSFEPYGIDRAGGAEGEQIEQD